MRRALLLIVALAAVGSALAGVAPVAAGGGGCHGEATEATASMVELRKALLHAYLDARRPGTAGRVRQPRWLHTQHRGLRGPLGRH